MRSGSSFPVATSTTWSVPSSVPSLESDTATSFPSGDGTKKSMAVRPEGSSAVGSKSVFSVAASRAPSVTRKGCCLGGWNFRAKSVPPRRTSPE